MGGRAGKDAGVAGVRLPGEGVEAVTAGRGRHRVVVEEDDEVAEDVQGLVGAAGRGLLGADPGDGGTGLGGVVRGDVPDVGLAGDEPVGKGVVGQGRDERLPLGRAGRDGGPLHAEVPSLEVDVVQLVPVDEAARGRVPDLRVVLPAVPQPADHLDVVGGLVEQLGEQVAGGRAVPGVDRRDRAAAEVCGLVRPRGDLHAKSGAAAADVVEGGDGLGDVERLRVRGHHGRHQAYVAGQRCDTGGDEHGVQPAAHLVGAVVAVEGVGGLRAEAVLDGHEVEQAALGLGDEVGPVTGGEQVPGPGHRLAPGGRMPAGARDRSSATARCREVTEVGDTWVPSWMSVGEHRLAGRRGRRASTEG